jgi:hypothetical protein
MSGVILTPGIVLAALEACGLYVLLDLLHAATGTLLPGIGLAVFFALPFACHLRVPRLRGRRLLWEAAVLLLFAAVLGVWMVLVPAPQGIRGAWILTAVLGGALWFLGSRAGRFRPDFGLFLGEFQFGLAILLVVYGLEARGGTGTGPLIPLTVLFFVLGLIGLFLCRDAGKALSSPGPRRRRHWGLLAVSLILVLAVTLWILAIIRPGLLAWALAAAEQIGAFLVRLVGRILDFLIRLFPSPDAGSLKIPVQHAPLRENPGEMANIFQIPEAVRRIGQYVVSAGWIGIVLVALWRVSTDILKWFRRRMGFSDGTEAESLKGAFREDLRRIVGTILARLKALVRRLLRGRRGRGLPPGAAGVRQAYRRLLEMGAAGGCPRKPARTPGEHLEALALWLPEARGEMAFITGRYVRARYGPGPVGEEVPGELTLCLRAVRSLLRKRGSHSLFRRRRACKVPDSPVETGTVQ